MNEIAPFGGYMGQKYEVRAVTHFGSVIVCGWTDGSEGGCLADMMRRNPNVKEVIVMEAPKDPAMKTASMSLEELKAHLAACDAAYQARRDAAFDEFNRCTISTEPYSDPARRAAYCQGLLIGRLRQINDQHAACVLAAVGEFFDNAA